MVDEKEFERPKKNKIDGYTYKQFKQMLKVSKRSSVYNHHAIPSWGSEEFKLNTVDEWIKIVVDTFEEDISIPSITVRRTWTQEQKKEFAAKLRLQPVAKVQ
jgi:hypothetical protein